MTQAIFLSTLISVMVAAGALGGVANYFLTRKEDPEGSNITKSIVIGIVAAFLVPLFLNMISSNLTEAIRGSPTTPADLSKILIFAGFCLIAAISSKAFIQTLSERVLKKVEETNKKVEEVKKVAQSAQEKASEADAIIQKNIESDGTDISGLIAPTESVSENERKILQELATGEKAYRTRTSVARHIGLVKSEVDRIVDELKEKSLVDAKLLEDASGAKRKRWYITPKGRAAVAASPEMQT